MEHIKAKEILNFIINKKEKKDLKNELLVTILLQQISLLQKLLSILLPWLPILPKILLLRLPTHQISWCSDYHHHNRGSSLHSLLLFFLLLPKKLLLSIIQILFSIPWKIILHHLHLSILMMISISKIPSILA